jgi:nucleotide-binding universal stress UspA family protein
MIAHAAGAILHLVHVHTPVFSSYAADLPAVDPVLDAESRRREQAYLESARQRLAATGEPKTTLALLDEPVAATLAGYVTARAIDLVVMTTHGRGGFSRLWLGSIADALVRHSCVPVLLIRPQETLPELEAPIRMRRILVPLDESRRSEQILAPAVELSRLLQAELRLLQVVQPLVLRGYAPLAYVEQVDTRATERLCRTAEQRLEQLAARLRSEGVPVQTVVIVDPQPAGAILRAATAPEIDLVAMATHGRGGLRRLLLGSVADKVLRGAARPVLISRPHTPPDGKPPA